MSEAVTPSGTSYRERTAEEIRVMLARRRISAAELARRTGMKQPYISRRMTGDVAWDIDDLERIAAILEVDVAELLPREGRVVTHVGAPTRQTTVPKVGLPQRPHTFGPANRNTPTTSTRRPVRIAAAAA